MPGIANTRYGAVIGSSARAIYKAKNASGILQSFQLVLIFRKFGAIYAAKAPQQTREENSVSFGIFQDTQDTIRFSTSFLYFDCSHFY